MYRSSLCMCVWCMCVWCMCICVLVCVCMSADTCRINVEVRQQPWCPFTPFIWVRPFCWTSVCTAGCLSHELPGDLLSLPPLSQAHRDSNWALPVSGFYVGSWGPNSGTTSQLPIHICVCTILWVLKVLLHASHPCTYPQLKTQIQAATMPLSHKIMGPNFSLIVFSNFAPDTKRQCIESVPRGTL